MTGKYKYKIARSTGIPAMINFINRKNPLIVTYHGIYERKDRPMPDTFIHVDNFVAQIAFINKKYKIITPTDFIDAIEGRHPLPDNSAMVTFDDGYESFYRLAAPILSQYSIKAVVFIPTRALEDGEPYWFDVVWLYVNDYYAHTDYWIEETLAMKSAENRFHQDRQNHILSALKNLPTEKRDLIVKEISKKLRDLLDNDDKRLSMFQTVTSGQANELSRRGVELGGHTHSHTILSSMTLEDVREEIRINKDKLTSITNQPCVLFAYPNGGQEDFNRSHKDILRQSGFKAAFSLTLKRSAFTKDPMDISRINVNPEDSVESFGFHCTGIVPFLNLIR